MERSVIGTNAWPTVTIRRTLQGPWYGLRGPAVTLAAFDVDARSASHVSANLSLDSQCITRTAYAHQNTATCQVLLVRRMSNGLQPDRPP